MGKYNLELSAKRDIERCKDVLENHGNDSEKLSSLFFELVTSYIDIKGFSKDFQVVNEYYEKEKNIKIYRSNLALIQNRLEEFLANNCEGLSKFTVKDPELTSGLFEAARVKISLLDNLSDSYKADVLKKLAEIKEICLSEDSRQEKWDKMRPFIMWLSGKDVESALIILPLITNLD